MRRMVRYLLAALVVPPCYSASFAISPASDTEAGQPSQAAQAAQIAQKLAAAQISLDTLEEPVRGRVAHLLQQPAVYTKGQIRAFPTRPFVYHWLLENPHLAARAWQGLGAKCAAIEKQADGVFTAADPAGGTVRWQKVCEQPCWRAWYAEGAGRPAPLTPSVTMRALVMLSYQEVRGADGRLGIRHQIEVLSQLEGKRTGWLARLTSAAVDQSAKKTLEQVELFFSGMAWYLSANPGSAKKLLTAPSPERPEDARQVERVLRELERP